MPLRAVFDADAAVRRLVLREESALRSAPGEQCTQGELDGLAGTKGIGFEVGRGGEVSTGRSGANGDAINAAARRVRHPELGEHRMLANVFEQKRLFAAELRAQLALPCLERHLRRLMQPRHPSLGCVSSLFSPWARRCRALHEAIVLSLWCQGANRVRRKPDAQ